MSGRDYIAEILAELSALDEVRASCPAYCPFSRELGVLLAVYRTTPECNGVLMRRTIELIIHCEKILCGSEVYYSADTRAWCVKNALLVQSACIRMIDAVAGEHLLGLSDFDIILLLRPVQQPACERPPNPESDRIRDE